MGKSISAKPFNAWNKKKTLKGQSSVILCFFPRSTYMAGKSSLTDSRLESMTFLGLMMLMLPMSPPTKLRRDSPEMAGIRPEVAGLPPDSGVDGLETGGEVMLTDRPRNSVS